MATLLLVDDHVNVMRSMAMILEGDGHRVYQSTSSAEASDILVSAPIDVVVTDVRLAEDTGGTELLRHIKQRHPDIDVVLITGFGTIDDAVAAIKSGAYDYLTKPVQPERLLITVRRAAERRALAREVKRLQAQVDADEEIVAGSAAMRSVLQTIAQVAPTDSAVLITGESGVGKELVARALYRASPRCSGKFVPVVCGAIPESLLESELFGHRKGAFTGAVSDKKGLLEEAHRGVLFLDEIGEMPVPMQVSLLRFLQSGEVRRIGATDTRRVDVRLVAATHRALEEEVAAGRFRLDFYYRINVVRIDVPPLRSRPDDVMPLAEHFVRRTMARRGHAFKELSPGAVALLKAYQWPGNVRELENAIERAVNLASGDVISEADLPAEVAVSTHHPPAAPAQRDAPGPPPAASAAGERERLVAALERCHWNQTHTAAVLGMSRTTLWRKLREHRIDA